MTDRATTRIELLTFLIIVAVAWWIFRSRTNPRPDLSFLPERFIVVDLETTGLNPDRHKIIEIAAIRVNRDSTRHDSFQSLIKITGKVPAKITEITGITNAMLDADGKPIETVLPQLLAFIGDLRIVTFNVEFDMAFLNAACARQKLAITNKVSCALQMARRAWPGRKSYKLSALAASGGMPTQTHRALADCELALLVYGAAAAKLRSIS